MHSTEAPPHHALPGKRPGPFGLHVSLEESATALEPPLLQIVFPRVLGRCPGTALATGVVSQDSWGILLEILGEFFDLPWAHFSRFFSTVFSNFFPDLFP